MPKTERDKFIRFFAKNVNDNEEQYELGLEYLSVQKTERFVNLFVKYFMKYISEEGINFINFPGFGSFRVSKHKGRKLLGVDGKAYVQKPKWHIKFNAKPNWVNEINESRNRTKAKVKKTKRKEND